MICTVAGRTFTGKFVADFLDFDIGQAVILQLDDDVRIQKRGFCAQPDRIVGKDGFDMYLLFQQEGKKRFQPFGSGVRSEDFLENTIL